MRWCGGIRSRRGLGAGGWGLGEIKLQERKAGAESASTDEPPGQARMLSFERQSHCFDLSMSMTGAQARQLSSGSLTMSSQAPGLEE